MKRLITCETEQNQCNCRESLKALKALPTTTTPHHRHLCTDQASLFIEVWRVQAQSAHRSGQERPLHWPHVLVLLCHWKAHTEIVGGPTPVQPVEVVPCTRGPLESRAVWSTIWITSVADCAPRQPACAPVMSYTAHQSCSYPGPGSWNAAARRRRGRRECPATEPPSIAPALPSAPSPLRSPAGTHQSCIKAAFTLRRVECPASSHSQQISTNVHQHCNIRLLSHLRHFRWLVAMGTCLELCSITYS